MLVGNFRGGLSPYTTSTTSFWCQSTGDTNYFNWYGNARTNLYENLVGTWASYTEANVPTMGDVLARTMTSPRNGVCHLCRARYINDPTTP